MTKYWRAIATGIGLVAALFIGIEVYPKPLFAYSRYYRGFDIASDRPIDPAITQVIEDARRRLATSEMTRPSDRFRIFICNSPWRLKLLTGNVSLGGGTVYATRNIFIRAANIPSNSIRPANGKALLDQRHRPLSYFMAHEATHVLELRRYGLLAMLRTPTWLVEGYADHVGKAGDFDVAENRDLLRRGDRVLTEDSGLYRRYQLLVETALGAKGTTIDALFSNPPPEDRLLAEAGR